MSTQIETSPRRHRRRDFLTISAAAATVVAGINVPSSNAAIADPLVALGERRKAAYADADRLAAAEDRLFEARASKAECKAANERTVAAWERVTDIDQQMIGLVPTTPAGAAAQAEVVRDFLSVSEYEPLIDNLIAGLTRMGGIS